MGGQSFFSRPWTNISWNDTSHTSMFISNLPRNLTPRRYIFVFFGAFTCRPFPDFDFNSSVMPHVSYFAHLLGAHITNKLGPTRQHCLTYGVWLIYDHANAEQLQGTWTKNINSTRSSFFHSLFCNAGFPCKKAKFTSLFKSGLIPKVICSVQKSFWISCPSPHTLLSSPAASAAALLFMQSCSGHQSYNSAGSLQFY